MARSVRSAIPPDASDPVAMTDWAELTMFAQSTRRLARANLRRSIREGTMLQDAEVEVACEFVLREVRRRRRLADGGYPFDEVDGGVEMRKVANPLPYAFMLCASASPLVRQEKRYAEIDSLFDNLVLCALKVYMGGAARGVRFAWPRSDGAPANFYKALDWLALQMGIQRGPSSERPDRKDGGVDVVVWSPFEDRRTGFLTVLAQCTVQLDWTPKAGDTIPDVWNGWLDLGKSPLTCLAIPHVAPQGFEKWDEVRRTVHIVLERFRLASLLAAAPLRLEGETRAWVDKELHRLAQS
jgi:hypothetical protein